MAPPQVPTVPTAAKDGGIVNNKGKNLALQRRMRKAQENEAHRLRSVMAAQQVQQDTRGSGMLGQTAVTAALCGDRDIGGSKLTCDMLRKHDEALNQKGGGQHYKLGRNASEVLMWKRAVQQSLRRQGQHFQR